MVERSWNEARELFARYRFYAESVGNEFVVELCDEALKWLQKAKELEQQVAELRAEVREWICDTCLCVFPRVPVKGFNLTCPECGRGAVMPKTLWENVQARRKIDLLTKDNNLLWKAIEAAEEFMSKCDCDMECDFSRGRSAECPLRKLDEALGALRRRCAEKLL